MLYTFSQSDYPQAELRRCLSAVNENDAVVLWQNGVLLAIKYPALFAACYLLEEDVSARNLNALLPKSAKMRLISMHDMVMLTEKHFPQFAL